MKKIGIFICNYNGKEYLLNCVDSVFGQSVQDFDVCVVDNASTDGSAETVEKRFGQKVAVLRNPENLGGSGGFDRGLKVGLSKGYEYIVLLDNDIILDNRALETMYSYLELHQDTGLVGAKVMIMDRPDTLQDYGDYLDFGAFRERLGYGRQRDDESLPKVNLCDYVPSCGVMIRADILRKSGTMPADNFIYFDDIELCHKIRLAGGKIAALGEAKVWHKGGFRKEAVNTFSRYYFLRNRLHFFAKYTAEEELERFVDVVLYDVFSQLAGFYSKGMREVFQTTMYAFDDFLHQVRGKADEYKILKITPEKTPFEKVIDDKERIVIKFWDMASIASEESSLRAYENLLKIITAIQKNQIRKTIWISLEQCTCGREEFMEKYRKTVYLKRGKYEMPKIRFPEPGTETGADLVLRMCGHVKNVETPVFPEIYVDQYCNCIAGEEDYRFFTGLEANGQFFADMYRPLMVETVKNIREGMRQNEKETDDNQYPENVLS